MIPQVGERGGGGWSCSTWQCRAAQLRGSRGAT